MPKKFFKASILCVHLKCMEPDTALSIQKDFILSLGRVRASMYNASNMKDLNISKYYLPTSLSYNFACRTVSTLKLIY